MGAIPQRGWGSSRARREESGPDSRILRAFIACGAAALLLLATTSAANAQPGPPALKATFRTLPGEREAAIRVVIRTHGLETHWSLSLYLGPECRGICFPKEGGDEKEVARQGGTIPAGHGPLYQFQLTLPLDAETAYSVEVSANNAAGTTCRSRHLATRRER